MELLTVSFDDVKAQGEAEKNYIANIIAANELQIEWMKAHPTFNLDSFPEGFDTVNWLAGIEADTPEGEALPGSDEYELFARALTLTSITTRLPIPEKYVLLDHYVAAAARALVVTHESLQKAKAELAATKAAAAGDGFNAMVSPDVDDMSELMKECFDATMAKLDQPKVTPIAISDQIQ